MIAAVYGTGAAFFAPAFDAVVPDIVPAERLAQANALDQLVRPLVLRMAGPALGGSWSASVGAGAVFALDARSFLFSAATLLAGPPAAAPRGRSRGVSVIRDLAEGWRFVRGRAWLWATFASAAVAYLLLHGPRRGARCPTSSRTTSAGAPATSAWSSPPAASARSPAPSRWAGADLPRRGITFIYVVWTLATARGRRLRRSRAPSGSSWPRRVAFNALETAGTIVWATLKQRHVPARMLGRVSSLDWLISIGLLPLSFALTGPVAGTIGTRATLVAAGVAGAVVTARRATSCRACARSSVAAAAVGARR